MKFKVILGWREEFIFDDLNEATIFANLAFGHSTEREDHIRIEFMTEKELEEVGEDG